MLHRKKSPAELFRRERHAEAGFSLLEILVGLSILAIIGTLTTVSGISMVESMRERTALKDIVNNIEMLRYVALTRDKQIIIASDAAQNAQQFDFQTGWQVTATPPVVFSRHGTCTTGSIDIISPSARKYSYLLVPQGCEMQSNS